MLKAVHIEWEDPAFALSEWMQESEFRQWAKKGIAGSDSVGLLVYENESYVVLAQSVGETQVAGGLKINRASIRSIRELGEVDIALDLGDAD